MARRLLHIGNISESPLGESPTPRRRGGVFRGLRLGERVRALSATALDRGQKQAEARLVDLLPDPGSLEGELSEKQTEEVLSGLEAVAGALRHARGPNAARARALAAGIYRAVQAPAQDSWDEDEEDLGGGLAGSGLGGHASVDVIGLDESGAMPTGRYGKGEWR